ncbi:MAG: hypothetical protein QMD80_04930 [archaeon]|nr:hypothetical protein [archaeon]
MGRRWEDFISAAYSKILPLIAFFVVIVGVIGGFFKSVFLRIEVAGVGEALQLIAYISLFTLVVVALFAFYQVALSRDIKDLLNERLPIKPSQGLRVSPSGACGDTGRAREGAESHRSNQKEEEEERIETSGAGALGGMVVGGVLGLPFGPAGLVIGGVLGALLGNQVEYESKRAERKKNSIFTFKAH